MTDFSSTYAEAMEEYRIAVREMEANDWINRSFVIELFRLGSEKFSGFRNNEPTI